MWLVATALGRSDTECSNITSDSVGHGALDDGGVLGGHGGLRQGRVGSELGLMMRSRCLWGGKRKRV